MICHLPSSQLSPGPIHYCCRLPLCSTRHAHIRTHTQILSSVCAHAFLDTVYRQTNIHTLFLPHMPFSPFKSSILYLGTVWYHVICAIIQTKQKLAKLFPCGVLSSEKQRHPLHSFEHQILHFSRSPPGIKWHMADESLWYLLLAPCIMFFIVPNFQQLDLINPGKTQRAQGSLNN